MGNYLAVVGYIGCVFAANWSLERWGFVPVGFGLEAPAGVFAAGVAFTMRDAIQEAGGRFLVLVAIAIGAALSWWVSPAFAVASGVAFAISEVADMMVYTPLRRRGLEMAVLVSAMVGSVVDSAAFLWLAFGSLAHIEGQIVGKYEVTAVLVLLLYLRRRACST